MSGRALALAVRDQLRCASTYGGLELGYSDKYCELAPLIGQPPAMAGEVFLGVWCPNRQATGRPMGALDDWYSVTVTLTVRGNGKTPFDRFGTQLWAKYDADFLKTGIDDQVDRIIACIGADCYDQRIIRRAELILLGDPGFSQALVYQGHTVEPVGPRWFNSRGNDRQYGIKVDVRFGQARRTLPFNHTPITIGPQAIATITNSSGTALVTTVEPHRLNGTAEITVSGTGNVTYDVPWGDNYTVIENDSFLLGGDTYAGDVTGMGKWTLG